MTADAGIVEAGARPQRNGNGYERADGSRATALVTHGIEHPDIGFGGYTIADLQRFASTYEGNITVIHKPGEAERIKQIDELPTDFFARHTDGLYYRSNKFGVITWALRDLKMDDSGVVATGEVGEGSGVGTGGVPDLPFGDGTEPHPPVEGGTAGFYGFKERYKIDTTKPMTFQYGTSKFGTPVLQPGVVAEGSIVVPPGMEGKGVQVSLTELTVGAGAKTLVITCDGDEVLNWGPEQMGGGDAPVAGVIGKDSPKPNFYGTVKVQATVGDKPCALALQWTFPPQQ